MSSPLEQPRFPRDITEIAVPPREVKATLDELGADGSIVSTQEGRCMVWPLGSTRITIGTSIKISTPGDSIPHGTQKIERIEEHEVGLYRLHDRSGHEFRFAVSNPQTTGQPASPKTTYLARFLRWMSAAHSS